MGSERTSDAAQHHVICCLCQRRVVVVGGRALRPAWNKGRIVGQKRPLKPKHVWAIWVRLELAENHRDLALFNLAIDSKLRGCDLVRMKVIEVMASGQIKERASVLQSKTKKPVRFEISEGWRRTRTSRIRLVVPR